MQERTHTDRAWLLGLPSAARLLCREPWLMGWLVLYLAITFGIEFAVLAVVGRLDDFGTWAIFPWLASFGAFTDRVLARSKLVAAPKHRSNQ